MTDDELKKEAVDALLDRPQASNPANPYGQKLSGMFAAEPVPDLGKVRARVLASRFTPQQQKTVKPDWRNSYLALAAVALLFFTGIILLNRYQGGDSKNTETAEKAVQMKVANYAKSVVVYYRNAETLNTNLADKKLTVVAKNISASFSFDPNADVKALEIQTHGIRVSVIGTKFIVDSSERGTVVAVREGRVRVVTEKGEYIVAANQVLSASPDQKVPAVTNSDNAALFDNFSNPGFDASKELQRKNTGATGNADAVGTPPITVTLRSGTVVKGFLIREDAAAIQVRVPAMGNKALAIEKSEIIERR